MITQQLVLGRTYRFKFKTVFVNHGVGADTCLHEGGGVFRLEQIASFYDITTAGIKLFENFFEPVGVTRDEYAAYFDGKPSDVFENEYEERTVDVEVKEIVNETQIINGVETVVPVERTVIRTRTEQVPTGQQVLVKSYTDEISYANYPIYKLVDVVDNQDILYVPQQAIAEFPEVDINQYADITLAIRLGFFEEASMLEPMLQAVKDRLALYGVYYDDVNLIVTDNKWMSSGEYDEIVAARQPGIRTIITDDNVASYANKTVIDNGAVKSLVATTEPADNEISIGNVIQRSVRITGADGTATLVDGNGQDVVDEVTDTPITMNVIGYTFAYRPNASITEIVTLDSDNVGNYVSKAGVVYKEVYVVDSSVTNSRNYFYLYEKERRENNKLKAQIQALEEIIANTVSNSGSNS